MFVEELDDVEAALVDVEVDVAHLEIGRHQGPFPHLRVGGLDGEPGARPHSPGMNRGLHCEKENLASMPDDSEDHVAHDFAVFKDAIGERSRRIQGLFNVGQWENRLRRCTALAGTSRRLLTRGETLPHEGSLRIALEVLERFLKVRDQRRAFGLSQGRKRDRHGLIVSVNGCKSDSKGLCPQRPGDGANDASPESRRGTHGTPARHGIRRAHHQGAPTRFDERNWGSRLVKLDT